VLILSIKEVIFVSDLLDLQLSSSSVFKHPNLVDEEQIHSQGKLKNPKVCLTNRSETKEI